MVPLSLASPVHSECILKMCISNFILQISLSEKQNKKDNLIMTEHVLNY